MLGFEIGWGRTIERIRVSLELLSEILEAPDAATLEAVETMRQNKISCLPVVKDERLVGILTERDLVNVAAELLERQLKE